MFLLSECGKDNTISLLLCSITKLMNVLNMYGKNMEPKSLFSISREEALTILVLLISCYDVLDIPFYCGLFCIC